MSEQADWDTVAVLPMRLQTEDFGPHIHLGHWNLVKQTAEKHCDILVQLGVPHTFEMEDNPLNYEMRREMLLARVSVSFPKNVFTVIPSQTRNIDYATRSRDFDKKIRTMYPGRKVVVYGASDSFIDKYSGELPVIRVDDCDFGKRATQLRSEIKIRHTPNFRAGVIWTKQNQPALGISAVDVVIADRNKARVILIRKEDEHAWRFPGVLFNPVLDDSFEAAANRTVAKEVPTVKTSSPYILASKRLDDWRLKRSKHKIVTILCFAGFSEGSPSAGVGVAEAKWFDFSEMMESLIIDHKPLGEIARKNGIR